MTQHLQLRFHTAAIFILLVTNALKVANIVLPQIARCQHLVSLTKVSSAMRMRSSSLPLTHSLTDPPPHARTRARIL
jgi:hypothetical protein